MVDIYNIDVKDSANIDISLSEFAGKTLLIVNVASKCGLTPQYEGLQKLYDAYKDRNFVVLGFPCNQFGGQEPGTDQEIGEFCDLNYSVTFPIFSKIKVNGPEAHPLFKLLKSDKHSGGPHLCIIALMSNHVDRSVTMRTIFRVYLKVAADLPRSL